MNKKNPEFSESAMENSLEERSGFNYRWIWTNTLTYNATFNEVHKLNVLLGTEAIRKLVVKNFPVIVVMDSQGNNLYETAIQDYCRE